MSLFGGIFSKDIKNSSSTTNTDNSRVNTLTDSLNTSINQNLALTRADSRTYNSAFDAVDSFNSVNSYEIYNNAGGAPSIPTLDFTGLRGLFSNPADLVSAYAQGHTPVDPNANKYNFDFSSISAGGNDFLKRVQDLTSATWDGLTNVTNAEKATPNSNSTNMVKYALIAVVVIVALFFGIKLLKR